MDKIKKLYAKIKEAKKSGKSLISELKKLNPKEIIAIKLEILKKQAIAFLMPFAGWAVLGLLAVGVILLVFYMLLGPLMAFLSSIIEGWNYLMYGTSGTVTSEEVKDVRQQLEDAGVNFEEIGYVGEEMFKIKNTDGNPIFNFLTGTSLYNELLANILVYGNARSLCDKAQEYQKEINDGNNNHLDALNAMKDSGITFYLKAYLAVQEQTFSDYNRWSVDDDKGAIVVEAEAEAKTFWESISSAISGSIKVEMEGRNFVIKLDKLGTMDVTQWVNDFAMPWQYPFTFHENTLSPDIGFKVAELGSKHHKLCLKVFYLPTQVVEVTYDADGNETSRGSFYEAKSSGEDAIKNLDCYEIRPTLIQTWYKTNKSDYQVMQYANAEEKTGIIKKTNSDGSYVEYVMKKSKLSESSSEEINSVGKNGMDNILMPNPEYEVETDANGKQTITLTNKSEVKAYFTANNATGNAKDITGKSEHEGKSVLAIKTSADTILKSIKDLYTQSGEVPVLVGDGFTKPAGTSVDYKESMGVDEYNNAVSTSKEKGGKEYDISGSPKVVRDLAEYFGTANIIDLKQWNLGAPTNFLFDANYMVWPLDEQSDQVSSFYVSDVTNNIITINSKEGTTVKAPFAGTVEKIDEHTIRITKTAQNAEGEETDAKVVIIGNINVTKTGEVAAGDAIGSTGVTDDTGNRVSSITYQETDISGQTIDANTVKESLQQMQTVAKSEWAWPVPAGTYISSYFGPRSLGSKPHTGIDIAEPRGSSIVAVADGTVIIKKSGLPPDSGTYPSSLGYGNWLIIDHGGGITTCYCHLNAITVSNGPIKKGEQVGILGHTGQSTGAHLHFEFRENGVSVDPLGTKYLGKYAKNGKNN